jgi:pyrroline-5-carboxylate reductase
MRAAQLKGLTTDQLVEKYRELSARHGRAIEAGNHKAANRDFDVIVSINKKLRERGSEAQRLLLGLLNDEEPGTRCWAAIDVLAFEPQEGERVLAELAKVPKSLVGLTAGMTLQQWKAGAFNPW